MKSHTDTILNGQDTVILDLGVKIKLAIEITGCTIDQAIFALYNCNNDLQKACLKIIDAGTDAAKIADSCAAVEKPPKKEKGPAKVHEYWEMTTNEVKQLGKHKSRKKIRIARSPQWTVWNLYCAKCNVLTHSDFSFKQHLNGRKHNRIQ